MPRGRSRRGRGRGKGVKGHQTDTASAVESNKKNLEDLIKEDKNETDITSSNDVTTGSVTTRRGRNATNKSATGRRGRKRHVLTSSDSPHAKHAKQDDLRDDASLDVPVLNKEQATQRIEAAIAASDPSDLEDLLITKPLTREEIKPYFLQCVENGDLELVKTFISAPYSPTLNLLRWEDGTLPLIRAVREDNPGLVRALTTRQMAPGVQREIRVDTKPLQLMAAEKDQLEILEILLKAGWDANAGYHYGFYPLHAAVSNRNKDMVQLLLSYGAKASQQADYTNENASPLMLAVDRDMRNEDDLEIVKMIINKITKRTINAQDIFQQTALFRAIPYGFPEVVKLLLDKGANPEIRRSIPDPDCNDFYASSCLLLAIEYGQFDMFKMMLGTGQVRLDRADDAYTYLAYAVQNKYGSEEGDYVQELLDVGAKPDWGNRKGQTAMHAAAESGNIGAFDLLLKHSGSLDIKTRQGLTPFLTSIQAGDLNMAKHLLTLNCDIHAKVSKPTESPNSVTETGSVVWKGALDLLAECPTTVKYNTKIDPADVSSFLRMLIEAGYDARSSISEWISADKWPAGGAGVSSIFSEEDKKFLKDHCYEILPLKCLARIMIRKQLGVPLAENLAKCGYLPQGFVSYLSFH